MPNTKPKAPKKPVKSPKSPRKPVKKPKRACQLGFVSEKRRGQQPGNRHPRLVHPGALDLISRVLNSTIFTREPIYQYLDN